MPRNAAIPANAAAAYFDLGSAARCARTLRGRAEYCGLFRTPTLRNVATRHTFFHNGVLHTLREAVAFYATRDTDPARWYPERRTASSLSSTTCRRATGSTSTWTRRSAASPGGQPALDEAEIDDIVAFLGTLTDGWRKIEDTATQ